MNMCNDQDKSAVDERFEVEIAMEETDVLHLNEDNPPNSSSRNMTRDNSGDKLVAESHGVSDATDLTRQPTRRNGLGVGIKRRRSRNHDSKIGRHLVTQHDYHDHALDPVNVAPSFMSPVVGAINQSPSITSSGLTTPFPTKLYDMIEEIEAQGLSHVVSWQPHGRCFKVHDMPTFKILIQNYFKLSKLASFQRQLNLYGFQRLTVGLDKGAYYHERFLRSRPDLVCQIERVKVKGTGVRAKANPDDEPKLYSYPPVDTRASLTSAVSSACSSCADAGQQMFAIQETNGIIAPTSSGDKSITLLSNVADKVRNTRASTKEGILEEPCAIMSGLVREEPCAIMSGLVRNLSSLNVLPSYFSESLYKPRITNMRNATFAASAIHQNRSFRRPNVLRNLSSCVLSNNQSFASMFSDDSRSADLVNEQQDLRHTRQQQKSEDIVSMDGNATIAVEKLRSTGEANGILSFDKLVDEMFQHNQDIEFPDLIKLATESDNEPVL